MTVIPTGYVERLTAIAPDQQPIAVACRGSENDVANEFFIVGHKDNEL